MMARVVLLLLVVVVAFVSVVNSVIVRGATPQDQGKYQQDTFTCFDGSKTIPISRVNDDYCDCESDGSDEPGTSACKKGKFYCANKLYVSELIYSSRVNDGICDCCDGSDEWNSKTKCPNTCREQGEHTRQVKAQEIEDYKEGLRVRQQYIEEAVKRRAEDQAKIVEFKAEIETLQASIAEKEAARGDTQIKEMAAREVLDKFKEPEVPIAPAPAVPEDKWDDHDEEEKEEEEVVENVEPAAEPVPEEPKKEEKPELTEEEKEQVAKAREVLEEAKKKKQEIEDLRVKVSDIERDIREKEEFLAKDFGPDNAYLPLYFGEALKYKTVEYTYELSPFKSVKQEWTSLGDWKKWLDNGKMKYDEGASCWGVPYRRNCEVSVVCGKENKILEVTEPNKCEYAMVLATPAACEPANLAALEKEYNNLVNPEETSHVFDAKDII